MTTFSTYAQAPTKEWPSLGMTVEVSGWPGVWDVVDARWSGGGYDHGPGPGNRYPDGWCVTFLQGDKKKSLYNKETGCFISSYCYDPHKIIEAQPEDDVVGVAV